MSHVARAAGIGRATLYKYFSDVESILIAQHARHVESHLRDLDALRAGSGRVDSRLVAVMRGYASICFNRGRHSTAELTALVHGGPEMEGVERRLRTVFAQVIEEAAEEEFVRTDVSAAELAHYCLRALPAAGQAEDLDQVERLVRVVLDGLGYSPETWEGDRAVARISHDGVASRRH
jgi:AcrR family transcriptional regulator